MPTASRSLTIIGAISLTIIGLMPIPVVRGNPVPQPNPYTVIGTDFEGTQFIFKCANVTLDVYAEVTVGRGTYVIENLANESNVLNVYFLAWIKRVNVTTVACNQTPIAFNVINSSECHYSMSTYFPSIDWSCMRNVIIPINFTANGTEVLEILWNFPSVEFYEQYYIFPEHIQWTTYNTGYVINGGNDWGGIPIEWEEVRFNFHTDAFFSQGRNISVFCNICNFSYNLRHATTVELPLDGNGVPYYLYHDENINISTCISILHVQNYQTDDNLAYNILYIAIGATIGFPLCLIRKARKLSVHLSLFGLFSSVVFSWALRGLIWNYWIIMLTIYLIGASGIILVYFLQPYLRKRLYRSELRNRISI